jgi:ElaB/YqjD/DUF883 family membrane-anchored ribosome-binding protein
MTTRSTKVGDEAAAIGQLVGELEKRLQRLSDQARGKTSEEADKVGDLISETLDRLRTKARESTAGVTQAIADEATRFSENALKKLSDEVEYRPLLMLASAAGIGFLAGLAYRR